MDLQFELLFSLAVIAALYGSVGHGGASGYLAVLSLSIFASYGAIWLKPHALCLNLVVASIGLNHYGRRGFFSMKFIQPFILTSIPFARQRAAQPLPITPAPTKAMRVLFVTVGVKGIATRTRISIYLPRKTGSRFSTNARITSSASSERSIMR